MRVAHVIRGLANSSGTTHIVIPLAEAQAELGCQVSVFHVDKPGQESLAPDPTKVSSERFSLSLPLDNPGVSFPFQRAFARRVREFDVVHIHAVWNFPTWQAMRLAERAGVPCVVAPQGSFDPWALGRNAWGKRLYGALTERPLLRRVALLQAVTAKELDQLRRAGFQGPATVIPNGIPHRLFDRARPPPLSVQLGLPEGERTLLFLSRVHPKKGLDLLIEAHARLRRDHRVTLVVAGTDRGSGYLAQMRRLAERAGAGAHVRFLGEVAGAAKLDVLQGADAYALLSRSEGLPVALLEALGAGLPCVASRECNLPEIAEAGAGWLVEPSTASGLAALRELFSNRLEAQRRAGRGVELIAQRYTWQAIARQTLEVYSMLCGARSAAGSVDCVVRQAVE